MKDIETRQDLELLLEEFYKVATTDKEIGHHFDDLDLESHLPVIVDFWEKTLFGKPVYFGNPLTVHQILNEKSPLTLAHFERWVKIFHSKIEDYFEGEKAEQAKVRVTAIAKSLNLALNHKSEK